MDVDILRGWMIQGQRQHQMLRARSAGDVVAVEAVVWATAPLLSIASSALGLHRIEDSPWLRSACAFLDVLLPASCDLCQAGSSRPGGLLSAIHCWHARSGATRKCLGACGQERYRWTRCVFWGVRQCQKK